MGFAWNNACEPLASKHDERDDVHGARPLLLMGDPVTVTVSLVAVMASIGVVCLAGGLHEHCRSGRLGLGSVSC